VSCCFFPKCIFIAKLDTSKIQELSERCAEYERQLSIQRKQALAELNSKKGLKRFVLFNTFFSDVTPEEVIEKARKYDEVAEKFEEMAEKVRQFEEERQRRIKAEEELEQLRRIQQLTELPPQVTV
jgi:membrane-bound lytic murein transglycosylase B